MTDQSNTTRPDVDGQPMLFQADQVPEMAIPVSEGSWEWRDARMLQSVERILFDPERLVDYEASVKRLAPDANPRGFLEFVIEQLGGRSQ